ncbi:MAG TPA: helix-turn-helix domain-containing protein [bacterium]|jgi:DNA-binding transcriptional regulator YiaG|nr:helix-turn-helix domain-containing protein [bacterium]
MRLKRYRSTATAQDREEALQLLASMSDEHGAKPFQGRLVYGAKSIKALRQTLGLTQKGLAKLLMVVPGAVESWEQGRRVPDTGRMAMIHLLTRHPKEFRPLLELAVKELVPEKSKALVK